MHVRNHSDSHKLVTIIIQINEMKPDGHRINLNILLADIRRTNDLVTSL